MLTLSHAIKTARLQEFIAQAEARGIEPAEIAKLTARLRRGDQTT